MKSHSIFYFLLIIAFCYIFFGCGSKNKEATVAFYKVVDYQIYLDSVKQKNGGMNWANIDYSPTSLVGKLQRKGPFTVEDTTMANEFLKKDRMPQNMDYAWIAHEDRAKTCILVIYEKTPILKNKCQ